MQNTNWSITDAYPNIKPMLEYLDAGIREQLFLIPHVSTPLGILNRPTWQPVNEPEPGIRYSTWVLKAAMKRSAIEGCSNLLVYNCDKVNGLGYVAPVGRIW